MQVYNYAMKIHRFFIGQGLNLGVPTLVLDTGLQNQLQNVFRLKVGDEIIAFDGSGYDYVSAIEGYGKNSVSLTIKERNKNTVLSTHDVYLFASIVKKDNFEWIVEKATEMGVSRIIPVVAERSEKKNLNIERLNKIMIEASEQSGRAVIPVLEEVCTLKLAIEKYKDIKSIVWHTSGDKFVGLIPF